MSGLLMLALLCCGGYDVAYMLPPSTETYHIYWLRDQQNPAAISAMLLTTQPLDAPTKLPEIQQSAGQPAAQIQQTAAHVSAEVQAMQRMVGPGHMFGHAPRAEYSYLVTTQGQEQIITPAQGKTIALVDLGHIDAEQKTVAQGKVTYTFEAGTLDQALKLFGDASNATVTPWNGTQEIRLATILTRSLAEQQQRLTYEKQSQTAALKNGG